VKKGNGTKSFVELALERFAQHDRRFDAMQQQIAELTTKLLSALGELQTELVGRLDATNTRIDQLIVNTGGHWRDLERRVSAIEDRLGPTE
jgi:hypothetical protein